jgi:cytochrome c5
MSRSIKCSVLLCWVLLAGCSPPEAPRGQETAAVAESWQPQVTERSLFVDQPSEQDQGTWAEYKQPFKLGRTPSPEELAGWDIDIRPDGKGLPPGSGSVEDGESLYDGKCALCHGSFGEGEGRWPQLAGGEETLGTGEPEKTVGSYWPYVSTLWDYVHRAMPYNAPQSLEDDEVYAIVAYVLYLNDLVEDDFVLDQDNLAGLEMPNRDGFFIDDRPDVQNARCMENCKTDEEIRLTHTIGGITPVGHFKGEENYGAGEVARETDALATQLIEASQLSTAAAAGEAVYGSACNVCHGAGLAGAPALGDRDNWTARLVSRGLDALLSNAVTGYTGDAGVMPPKGGQMQLTDDEVGNAVRFMLESSGFDTEAGQ